jgi:hypothetical protein
VIWQRKPRLDPHAPGDLPSIVTAFMDDWPLLKVVAEDERIRFDPASWLVRRKYRATLFGRNLGYLSFKIAGWRHRPYTDEEWAHLEKLYDDSNPSKLSDYRPRRDRGVVVLDWPIIMQRGDQRFPEAFDLIIAKLGSKPRRISVNGFNRIKKQALRDVLQQQQKAGKVDPELEAVNHWSM